MRIAVVTDMEGVAGLLNFKDWCMPGGRYYEVGRRLLTEETNAAVRGFFDAGADEVVIIDGHGEGGVDPLLLDERALYSRGWAHPYRFGLEEGFDAIAWVGQHAKAGTVRSHLAHTCSFHMLERRINGISVGEPGYAAMVAGAYGTSAIFASGERALAEEMRVLQLHIHTVEVKHGVTPDNGADCTAEQYEWHNRGAVHLHHNVACRRIYEGAKAALLDFTQNPDRFPPLRVAPPYTLETWYRAHGDRPPYKTVQRHPSDLADLNRMPEEKFEFGSYAMP